MKKRFILFLLLLFIVGGCESLAPETDENNNERVTLFIYDGTHFKLNNFTKENRILDWLKKEFPEIEFKYIAENAEYDLTDGSISKEKDDLEKMVKENGYPDIILDFPENLAVLNRLQIIHPSELDYSLSLLDLDRFEPQFIEQLRALHSKKSCRHYRIVEVYIHLFTIRMYLML